jgi:hypothetical protein
MWSLIRNGRQRLASASDYGYIPLKGILMIVGYARNSCNSLTPGKLNPRADDDVLTFSVATAIDLWSRGRLAHLIDNVIRDFAHIFIDELSEYSPFDQENAELRPLFH